MGLFSLICSPVRLAHPVVALAVIFAAAGLRVQAQTGKDLHDDPTVALLATAQLAVTDAAATSYPGLARAMVDTFTEETKLTASDADAGDLFGVSVSISGDRALVGAYYEDCADGSSCGSAYVFAHDGSRWIEEQKLVASDAADHDWFGHSVSLFVDRALVGSHFDDCGAGSQCGSAYVFAFDGSSWVEEQKLTASDTAPSDIFGFSVSLSDNRALIGANGHSCTAGFGCGSVYVFVYDGSNWIEEQRLTASDADVRDQFGHSVSLSGDRALIGSFFDDCAAGLDCGSAYVFAFDGSIWTEEQKLTAAEADANDFFGISVSLSDDRALIGAHLDDCAAGHSCGSAYVFAYDDNSWTEQQKLTASYPDDADRFGYSVSLSGDRALVGADGDDCAAGVNCGAAYVFAYDGSIWNEEQILTASDAAVRDWFGHSVSLSGDVALIGAYADDCAAGDACGSAYVFEDIQPSSTDGAELPAEYVLHAAYPNPFNTRVVVPFAIPEPAEIRLSVFDTLGREVALLVNGPVGAGTHEAILQASNRQSGVYVIRLLVDDGYVASQRVTLAK